MNSAAPVLARAFAQQEYAHFLRTMAFLDHPVTVPALVGALASRPKSALLALEQVAADPGMRCAAAARDAIAARSVADVDELRALARLRDERAFFPLRELRSSDPRTAVAGLADLCIASAAAALVEAPEDTDIEVAVRAVHGLLRARAADVPIPDGVIETAIDNLARRSDPAAGALAHHWHDTWSTRTGPHGSAGRGPGPRGA